MAQSANNAGDLGSIGPLEKEMATHSSTLAWKIPWMEEPGRLQSMGSQRVRQNYVTSLHFTSAYFWIHDLMRRQTESRIKDDIYVDQDKPRMTEKSGKHF